MGEEFGNTLAWWLWHRISLEVSVKMLGGAAVSSEGLMETAGSTFKMKPSHLAGRLSSLLAPGRRPQFLTTWVLIGCLSVLMAADFPQTG